MPRLSPTGPLLAALLAACTRTPDPPAPSASAASSAPSALPAGRLPPPVDRPGPVACAIEAEALPESATLRLGATGPEYAVVKDPKPTKDAKTRLSLPAERGEQGAWLELSDGGVMLSGATRADEVVLYPARAIRIGDVVTLKPAAHLRWIGAGASAGRVRAELVPRNRMLDRTAYGIIALPAGPQDLACEDVAPAPKSFEARPKDPPTDGKWALLDADHPIGVSAEPGGKPQVTLRLMPGRHAPDPALVFVEETRGAEARVVLSRPDAVVVGWVPSAGMTRMFIREAADFGGIGLGADADAGAPPAVPRTTCRRPLPLVAEREGVRATVGRLAAGVAFAPGARGDELTRIDVALPDGITLAAGAWLSTPTAALAGCGPGP